MRARRASFCFCLARFSCLVSKAVGGGDAVVDVTSVVLSFQIAVLMLMLGSGFLVAFTGMVLFVEVVWLVFMTD